MGQVIRRLFCRKVLIFLLFSFYLQIIIKLRPKYKKRFREFLRNGSLESLDEESALDLLDWTHRAENISDGSPDWFVTCGSGWLEYDDCKGHYRIVWKRGYSALIDILMVAPAINKAITNH